MTRSLGVVGIATALASAALAPAVAHAVPARVLAAAEHSVAAAEHTSGATAAFAFGTQDRLVTAAETGDAVQAVTSSGASVSGTVGASRDGLAVARMSSLPLRPLVASRATTVSAGTAKYVVGPPLSYGVERVRRVAMPSVRLHGHSPSTVRGSLPRSFAGSPVLSRYGTLVGAVASVGRRSWLFVPLGVVEQLTAPSGGDDVPWFAILVGAALIFLGGVAFGLLRANRRREREQALRVRQHRARKAAKRRGGGPLVRLRTPADAQPDAQHLAADNEEDFEVVVKPRGEQS